MRNILGKYVKISKYRLRYSSISDNYRYIHEILNDILKYRAAEIFIHVKSLFYKRLITNTNEVIVYTLLSLFFQRKT